MSSAHVLPLGPGIAASFGNHLWQSSILVGIVAIFALILRSNRPSLRYGLWIVASLKFLFPFSLLVAFGTMLPKPHPIASQAHMSLYSALEATSVPFDALRQTVFLKSNVVSATGASGLLLRISAAIWLIGVAALLLVWYVRWRQILTAMHKGELAHSGREVDILRSLERELNQHTQISVVRSREMMEPGIFGIVRPTLLWPAPLTARLEDAQIRAILAHELAHVRRRDNLTAAIHMFVEALFWFHPLVWWMEARMVQERERACDEDAVQTVGVPEVYAESLLRACRFCLESPLVCVSGIAGASLRDRIVRITTHQKGARLSLTRKLILVLAALGAVGIPMCNGVMGAMQSKASLLHPSGSRLPAFEIATVKPNKDVSAGFKIDLSPSDFNAIGGSVKDLINFAYNVNSHDQLQGQQPSRMSSLHFDIHAKASETDIARIQKLEPMQQVKELQFMLQSLLADRFHLNVSFKTADLPVYALVVAKGGPKLEEVQVDPLPLPGAQPRPGAHLPRFGKTGAQQYTATAWDMSSTADMLSQFDEVGHRLVVDETGLKGHYDFVLNGVSLGPSPDGATASIFTALKEQLGLELVPRKAPVEVLVIDSVQQPSEN